MKFNILDDWLVWQEQLHFSEIELGLERCSKVAGRMGLLNPDFTVINIAGTNGKGSSIAMMDAILSNCGYKTGCYTSPHLMRYNERIKINGDEVSNEMLCQSFEQIDNARRDIYLTYFEFGTLAALDIFHRSDIDIALLEVGLGGRLDAVNCFDADVALISTVGIDHTQWLGGDRESIGYEKAGIFRSNTPAVCSDPQPPKSIHQYAYETGAVLYIADIDFDYQLSDNCWAWQSKTSAYENLPLPGQYNSCQVQNAAGVLMVLDILKDKFPINTAAIEKGLRKFNLSGRFQVLAGENKIILDVAHNIQAAEVLVSNLEQFQYDGKIHVIIGMLKDKDQKGVMSKLSKIANYWYTVTIPGPRGSSSVALRKELLKSGVTAPIIENDTVADAFSSLQDKIGTNDCTLVMGSFITVGSAIRYLQI